MILDLETLSKELQIKPNGVLHVGAHKAEERTIYNKLGWTPIYWVEAQSHLAAELQKNVANESNIIIQSAIYDVDDCEMKLNISSNSESSSLLEFGTHKIDYADIRTVDQQVVLTNRLDTLFLNKSMPNFLNVDIQGVELRALKSLGSRIKEIDYIYTEVNKKEVYVGCDQVKDIDKYLKNFGFQRLTTRWIIGQGWGDALYCRVSFRYTVNWRLQNLLNEVFKFYLPKFLPSLKHTIKVKILKPIRKLRNKF